MKLAGVLATLALLLAACGGSSEGGDDPKGESPKDWAAKMSECSDVWVEGKTLPKNYEGCLRGDTIEAGVTTDCSDGNGDLATFDNKFMARLGGKILAMPGGDSGPAYSKEFDACTGA